MSAPVRNFLQFAPIFKIDITKEEYLPLKADWRNLLHRAAVCETKFNFSATTVPKYFVSLSHTYFSWKSGQSSKQIRQGLGLELAP